MEAENKKVGLWSWGVFQLRSNLNWEGDVPVITWEDADKYYNQYVIVEGTVVDAHHSGKACSLYFHSDWKLHITAVFFLYRIY